MQPGGGVYGPRNLQVTRGFMDQPPATRAPVGPAGRTRPSIYPDVQGFAQTPVGRVLLRSIMERMGQRQPAGRQRAGPALGGDRVPSRHVKRESTEYYDDTVAPPSAERRP